MRLPNVEVRLAWSKRLLLWGEILVIGLFLFFRAYVFIATPSPILSASIVPQPQPDPVPVTLKLKRGDFTVYRYVPRQAEFAAHPKAVIIFGSGDGGADGWEDRVCKALQADGYEVLNFDCAVYSKTDFDLDILQGDMNTIAQSSLSRYWFRAPPLIIGGWSMGAELAVPAGGGPHRPAGLIGLLVISPESRGRYGLRVADRWDVLPTGDGTYALQDFAHQLDGLRVVQWDGNLDVFGYKEWLNSVTTPHKALGFPSMHDFNGASDEFLTALKRSLVWILSPKSSVNE